VARLTGADLPHPVADPPVGVELGGPVAAPRTDGALVTAIIHPFHGLAFATGEHAAGRLSRMGRIAGAMTVSELIDVVAFLHSRHEVIPHLVVGP